MTFKVLTVEPETPLSEAIDIVSQHGFNGLPVVDKNGKLAGLLTEYDFTIRGSSIYLPTLLKILEEFKIYKKDRRLIKDDLKKILVFKVKDIMNSEPLTLGQDVTVEDLVKTFAEHHRVNPIPIIDKERYLLGIVSRSDIIKIFGITPSHIDQNNERSLDKGVKQFLDNFEKNFISVTKFRTHYWFIFSLTFLVIGFIIAMALVLRLV